MQWFVEKIDIDIDHIKIIDKLKYEKWSKYRFKQPKCIVLGTPKNPEKGQERTYPQQELIFMFKSVEI